MEKNEDLQKKINESIAYSHTPDHIRKQGLTIKYKEKANKTILIDINRSSHISKGGKHQLKEYLYIYIKE